MYKNGVAMKQIRILFAEDDENDVTIAVARLRDQGFEPTIKRVETAEEFKSALNEEWDCIISDYKMPTFTGEEALAIAKASGSLIPFILVSGTIGEEVAVDMMKQGASDYLLKDKLGRLGAAITRAMDERQLQLQHSEAQERLRESERRFQEMLGNVDLIAMTLDRKGRITFCNDYLLHLTGWKREEVLDRDWFSLFLRNEHPEGTEAIPG